MKLGKIGIFFLAAVLVLSGIAGAFAAWTDKVDIEGTVATGTVELNLEKTSSTWVYKVPPHEIVATHDWNAFEEGNIVDPEPPVNGELIASAVAEKLDDKNAYVTLDNLFPSVAFKVNFLFHYDGSIPARLSINEPVFTGKDAAFFNGLVWTLPGQHPSGSYMYGEMWTADEAGNPDVNIRDLEGFQVKKCTYILLVITIYIGQGDDPDNPVNTQGLEASFTAGITATQWNKYVAPETLYLSDGASGTPDSTIYRVKLDDATGQAKLTQVAYWGDFPQGHIGHAVDKNVIYAIERDAKKLRVLNVDTGTWIDKPIQDAPTGLVQVAMSPQGKLYAVSQNTNKIYEIEDYDTNPKAVEKAFVGVNVSGADIAFASTQEGTVYMYTSAAGVRGLYTLDLDTGDATLLQEHSLSVTGLALRDNGKGDLIASVANSSKLYVFDKVTGETIGDPFTMYLYGAEFTHSFGDMTIGQFAF